MNEEKEVKPSVGYRLAWRQNMPGSKRSIIAHTHGVTLHNSDEALKRIAFKMNAGYARHPIKDGRPQLVTWVEWKAVLKTEACSGNYGAELQLRNKGLCGQFDRQTGSYRSIGMAHGERDGK